MCSGSVQKALRKICTCRQQEFTMQCFWSLQQSVFLCQYWACLFDMCICHMYLQCICIRGPCNRLKLSLVWLESLCSANQWGKIAHDVRLALLICADMTYIYVLAVRSIRGPCIFQVVFGMTFESAFVLAVHQSPVNLWLQYTNILHVDHQTSDTRLLMMFRNMSSLDLLTYDHMPGSVQAIVQRTLRQAPQWPGTHIITNY